MEDAKKKNEKKKKVNQSKRGGRKGQDSHESVQSDPKTAANREEEEALGFWRECRAEGEGGFFFSFLFVYWK